MMLPKHLNSIHAHACLFLCVRMCVYVQFLISAGHISLSHAKRPFIHARGHRERSERTCWHSGVTRYTTHVSRIHTWQERRIPSKCSGQPCIFEHIMACMDTSYAKILHVYSWVQMKAFRTPSIGCMHSAG
jgi:hypothetical protein